MVVNMFIKVAKIFRDLRTRLHLLFFTGQKRTPFSYSLRISKIYEHKTVGRTISIVLMCLSVIDSSLPVWRHTALGGLCKISLHIRESKIALDSGFHAVDSGFQVLDFILFLWNLDSEFRSLGGFQIPWAVFWIPKPKISDSTSKIFPDFGFHKQKFLGFRNPNSLTCHENLQGTP